MHAGPSTIGGSGREPPPAVSIHPLWYQSPSPPPPSPGLSGEQSRLDAKAYLGTGEVGALELRDASAGHLLERDVLSEGELGQDGDLRLHVMTLHVSRRVGCAAIPVRERRARRAAGFVNDASEPLRPLECLAALVPTPPGNHQR